MLALAKHFPVLPNAFSSVRGGLAHNVIVVVRGQCGPSDSRGSDGLQKVLVNAQACKRLLATVRPCTDQRLALTFEEDFAILHALIPEQIEIE
eukprot:5321278-Amphidinium_carterae.1